MIFSTNVFSRVSRPERFSQNRCARFYTYDPVAVGVPEQSVAVSSGRTGQVQEKRVGAPGSTANAFDVPPDVQLVGGFDVVDDGRRVIGTVCWTREKNTR